MSRSTIELFLAHLIGNAALLWLGYYWLGLNESDAAHLVWSAVIVLFFACCALWLHGTALVMFNREAGTGFRRAANMAFRHLPPLLTLAIGAVIIYGLIAYWHDSFGHKAFVIGSYATMKLRKPVPPSGVQRAFFVLIWLLRWVVVPVFLLPLAGTVAARGWSGFRLAALRRSKQFVWWIQVCALLLLAILVPLEILAWVPKFNPFAIQMLSFIARIGAGYLLFVAALLALEFFTSAGKPRFSQPSTVSSP
jgi:hypothetical protein